MNTSEKRLLQTDRLTVGYRKDGRENVLFRNLDLQLFSGSLVCFMGPNGIGKSTLIRTLAGIQPSLSGSVTNFSGRRAALVLTEKVQSYAMTVQELVSYGRYPYLPWTLSMKEEDRSLIKEAMTRVRIDHLAGQRIAELSDGQLQMVMIAKALAQDAPILLLDEPTAHLDLNNRVEIMNMLREIARQSNKAVLIATHELDLALQTSDRIWLAAGQQVEEGLPEDLVLDGSFDRVFRFKGFDLKTGKVLHQPYRKEPVQLEGSGPEYLWTKNALERSGYIVAANPNLSVSIETGPVWRLKAGDHVYTVRSVEQLLSQLGRLST